MIWLHLISIYIEYVIDIGSLAIQHYKEIKNEVLKWNVLVKVETITVTSGSSKQHYLRTSYRVKAWHGVELQPDDSGFCTLGGKYRTLLSNFLLPQVPMWNHSLVIVRLITALVVTTPTGSTTCHARICVVYNKAWPVKTSSHRQDIVVMVTISLNTDKLSLNTTYHIKFAFTIVTATWLLIQRGVLKCYHLACFQIVEIIQELPELWSFQSYTLSVALDWHRHMLDIRYMNIIRYILLYFSYLCVPWTWIQSWYYWYLLQRECFDDVNLVNRLLLSCITNIFLLLYVCYSILSIIYPGGWCFV